METFNKQYACLLQRIIYFPLMDFLSCVSEVPFFLILPTPFLF